MAMNKLFVLLGISAIWGCAMFTSWKAIPPPGGCDQCHTKAIGNNWQIAMTTAIVHDETGREPWQRPESMLPPESSPLEQQKITEQRCFRCHKGPNRAHIQYRGRYHH